MCAVQNKKKPLPSFILNLNVYFFLITILRVTNCQFPEAIKTLKPVTQLYVSVDAPNKAALKEVDRPLFKDFWERLIASLKALRLKKQRTVYRLTLVKGWNDSDIEGYVRLIDIGAPELIEVKGVTYCGAEGGITMANVPWHEEVLSFAEALAAASKGRYAVACIHRHSCCVLLADKAKYWKEGGEDERGNWYTWIDYEKFHSLVKMDTPFTSSDYMLPTPTWALPGAEEEGFDPKDVRWYHNKKLVKK